MMGEATRNIAERDLTILLDWRPGEPGRALGTEPFLTEPLFGLRPKSGLVQGFFSTGDASLVGLGRSAVGERQGGHLPVLFENGWTIRPSVPHRIASGAERNANRHYASGAQQPDRRRPVRCGGRGEASGKRSLDFTGGLQNGRRRHFMSKLKDLNKGVRLIARTRRTGPRPRLPARSAICRPSFEQAPPKPEFTRSVARRRRPARSTRRRASGTHGYGIDKVAGMLESKRSRRCSAGEAARCWPPEAASVPIHDVIRTGCSATRPSTPSRQPRRQKSGARDAKRGAHRAIRRIDAFLKEKNTEMEGLKQAKEAADRAFQALQARKRREEQRLFDLVSHFLEGGDNPISTAGPLSPPPPPAKPSPDQA